MVPQHHSTSDHSSIENIEAMTYKPDTQPRQPKKSVHFANTCKLKLIRMPTDKDRTNAWYQSADYKRFKKQMRSTITCAQEVGENAIEDMLDNTCDGLECMISQKRAQLRLRRRYFVWDCVIDGQDNHETPERIAESCSAVSSGSSLDARRSSALIHMAAFKPKTAAAPDKKKEKEQTSKHVLVVQHAQNTRAAGTTRRLYQSVVRSGQRLPRTSRVA